MQERTALSLKLQSKMTVYAAIAGMLGFMGLIVYYSSLDVPALEQAQIDLVEVNIIDVNNIQNKATVEVVFLVGNPSEKTFTVPSITYELYGDGQYIGAGQYALQEDIALTGRVIFFGNTLIPLKSNFVLSASESDLYHDVLAERIRNYSATGVMTVESAWSIVEPNFNLTMP